MEKQQNIFEAIKRVVHDENQTMRDEIRQFKDEILISNDKIAGRLSRIETEMAAFTGS